MIKFLAIVVLVGVAIADPASRSIARGTPEGRIIGGQSVSIEEVPYQVHILLDYLPCCGGSIIASRWVLTAGHCATEKFRRYSIFSGSARMFWGKSFKVDRIVQHENYRQEKYGIPVNDIALFKTATPFVMSPTQNIIALYNIHEETKVGAAAVITGWGAINENGSAILQLQMVIVPIVNKTECKSAYVKLTNFNPGQICAGYPQGGKDSCQGDSGGPLAVSGRLAGVVSWGNGCALPGQPGVYTEVAAYREWIDRSMKLNGSSLTQTVGLGTLTLILIAHMTSTFGLSTQ